MNAFFKSNTFQIFGAAMGSLIWISVSWEVLKAWYVGSPPTGVVAATAAMACVALALQILSNGIKLIWPR
jgi:hypothetical protein